MYIADNISLAIFIFYKDSDMSKCPMVDLIQLICLVCQPQGGPIGLLRIQTQVKVRWVKQFDG